MQIRVKSLQGDEYLIQVQNEHTVYQLKASISEKANGLPIDRQKLVYKGRTMQDTSPLSDYNLEEDCKVHLIVQKGRETSPTGFGSNPSHMVNTGTIGSTSSTTCQPNINQSSTSQFPMDTSSSLRNNDEMIRILGEWGTRQDGQSVLDKSNSQSSTSNDNNNTHHGNHQPTSRLEVILRERLAAHFPSRSIDRIMDNLYKEIDADVNSSSLDDLERLAKQKLNITNE